MLFNAVALIGLLATFGSAIPTISDMTPSANQLFSRAGVSTDGTCGGGNAFNCTGSTFGDCCSRYGFCGNTTTYCGASFGCNPAFGTCTTTSVSPDGSCGGTTGYTCTGSTFGTCCSANGYCGSDVGFCAQGCQPSSGTCTTGTVSSNSGECGATRGNFTCAGGPYNGDCCSPSGYCGTSTVYCGTGCQAGFGNCTTTT